MQTSLQSHTSEWRQKPQIYLLENCFRIQHRTDCPHSREDPEDCWCFRHCIIKVLPEHQHKRPEVMFQANSTRGMEEDIIVDNTTVNHVQELNIIARDGHIEAKLQRNMSMASMSFGNNHNASIALKGKVFVRTNYPPCCTGLRHGPCKWVMWKSYMLS